MDIKKVLLQWLINFLIKKTPGSGITNENISNKNKLDNYTSQSLESLKNKV